MAMVLLLQMLFCKKRCSVGMKNGDIIPYKHRKPGETLFT